MRIWNGRDVEDHLPDALELDAAMRVQVYALYPDLVLGLALESGRLRSRGGREGGIWRRAHSPTDSPLDANCQVELAHTQCKPYYSTLNGSREAF